MYVQFTSCVYWESSKQLLLMINKFSFLYVDIQFDELNRGFIFKNSNLKCWLCFRLLLWRINFGAPLKEQCPGTDFFLTTPFAYEKEDHLNNVKRGGVSIYYKESLPVRKTNLPYLQEALLLELNDQNKKNNFIKSLSLSQSKEPRIRKLFNKL